ncbi:hypothetical protein MCAL106L_0554 [Mycoplasmopsis californica]|uniref:hypothetical protein n=1 Tax=Mycoplasmopsis californica TaxID=2113 RepID=UPI000EB6E9B5|nr:hypothetical protein [Mycoplasmopsis californica]BBG40949.1 hypothetical protein MCAL106_0554 [Mycoplasmopsis californica]BBG41543.1 hypothetical protein MCAL106E_0554 [Mycoplasmopsis californica]BBG42136.1 hypothetical protein MCAL106L_0554 [Mycoplasmopsis californica]
MSKRKLGFLSLALTSVVSIPLTVISCAKEEIDYEKIISISVKEESFVKEAKDVEPSDILTKSSDKNYTPEIKTVTPANNKPGAVLVILDVKDKSGKVVFANMQKSVEGFKIADKANSELVSPPPTKDPEKIENTDKDPQNGEIEKDTTPAPQAPDKDLGHNNQSDKQSASEPKDQLEDFSDPDLFNYLNENKKIFTFDPSGANITKIIDQAKSKNRIKITKNYDEKSKKSSAIIVEYINGQDKKTGLTVNSDIQLKTLTHGNVSYIAPAEIKFGKPGPNKKSRLKGINLIFEDGKVYAEFRLVKKNGTVGEKRRELIYTPDATLESAKPDVQGEGGQGKQGNTESNTQSQPSKPQSDAQSDQSSKEPKKDNDKNNLASPEKPLEKNEAELYKNPTLFKVAKETGGKIFKFDEKKEHLDNLIAASKDTNNRLKIQDKKISFVASKFNKDPNKKQHGLSLIDSLSSVADKIITHPGKNKTIDAGKGGNKHGIYLEGNLEENSVTLVYYLVKKDGTLSEKFEQKISINEPKNQESTKKQSDQPSNQSDENKLKKEPEVEHSSPKRDNPPINSGLNSQNEPEKLNPQHQEGREHEDNKDIAELMKEQENITGFTQKHSNEEDSKKDWSKIVEFVQEFNKSMSEIEDGEERKIFEEFHKKMENVVQQIPSVSKQSDYEKSIGEILKLFSDWDNELNNEENLKTDEGHRGVQPDNRNPEANISKDEDKHQSGELKDPNLTEPKKDSGERENQGSKNKKQPDNNTESSSNSDNPKTENAKKIESDSEAEKSDVPVPNVNDSRDQMKDKNPKQNQSDLYEKYLYPDIKRIVDQNNVFSVPDDAKYQTFVDKFQLKEHPEYHFYIYSGSIHFGKSKSDSKKNKLNEFINLSDEAKTHFRTNKEKDKQVSIYSSSSQTANTKVQYIDWEKDDSKKTITFKFKTPLKEDLKTLSEEIKVVIQFKK